MIDFRSPVAMKIRRQLATAVVEYNLIEPGDRVMVCVSGGKDSTVLLALLTELRKRAPIKFDIEGVLLDQKQPGFDGRAYQAWVENEIGAKLTILERDTYSIVKEKTVSRVFCSMCSRLRRGILYNHAVSNGFTKLALGHHRDDAAETLLLNLFYTGKLQAMPPKFKSDDGRNIVIRPLFSTAESDLLQLSEEWKIPTIPCNLCGSQDGLKRKQIKKLITDLEKTIPDIRNSMAGAIGNVRTSHLADSRVWDFRGLSEQSETSEIAASTRPETLIGSESPVFDSI
jgi:tRNA 2-thiocytidine biosynthesis protein TtcA